MEKMLVSVIIPIYKVENYLNQCIESVVNQTYKNLEIILIDDGSPDNSFEIAEMWKKRDSRISLIRQKNRGLSAARNAGIENAHGEWLAFIDSDDYVDKNYIKEMLAIAHQKNVKLVNCNYMEVDESTKKISAGEIKLTSQVYSSYEEFWDYYYNNRMPVAMITAWSKLYHKSIFKNLRYKKGILNEDDEIIYSVVKKASKIAVINKYLYFYRINRKGSIMSQLNTYAYKLNTSGYDILNNRVRDFMSDGLYNNASKCNDSILYMLLNDYTLAMSSENNQMIFKKNLKVLKNNVQQLRKKGQLPSKKTVIFLQFPYAICFLKKLKRKFTLIVKSN